MSTSNPLTGKNKRSSVRIATLAILLLLTLSTGCTLPTGAPYSGATPKDAVLEKHGAGTTIIGSRTSGGTTVVLATDAPVRIAGGEVYADIVTRMGLGWNIPFGVTSNGSAVVPATATLCYATAEVFDQHTASTFVYGYVQQPGVQKVEVDFASGQTLDDESTDGMFAVIQPMLDTVTTVRALDNQGKVIHTDAVPTPRPTQPPPPGSKGVTGGARGESFTCTP